MKSNKRFVGLEARLSGPCSLPGRDGHCAAIACKLADFG
jgi:hypothetical protein